MNELKRKPLQNQALIYDKDCPMCCIYTSAFIKAGVLEENGRQPYTEQAIDSKEWNAERAKNEIALVNYENGTVTYGIDSMFTVIGHRFGFLKPLFNWKPFHWVMKKFYSFISYNRKVIAPPAKNKAEITCVPDVNLKYRWMYIVFAVLFTAAVNALALRTIETTMFWPALTMITGIIILRLAAQVALVETEKRMDYLGNLVTINLQLGCLVAPIFLTLRGPEWLAGAFQIYALAVVLYINYIHVKRLKSLNMNPSLCVSWIIQWIFIYLLTLTFITLWN